MIPLVEMGWIHLAFVFILLKNHEICLKLKSGFRIMQISNIPETLYMHLFHSGPSNAMKLERFGGGKNFRRW
jgi:hypothetical protein